jgi:hypothetical protein
MPALSAGGQEEQGGLVRGVEICVKDKPANRFVKRSDAIRCGVPEQIWRMAVREGKLKPAQAGGKIYRAADVETSCACEPWSVNHVLGKQTAG